MQHEFYYVNEIIRIYQFWLVTSEKEALTDFRHKKTILRASFKEPDVNFFDWTKVAKEKKRCGCICLMWCLAMMHWWGTLRIAFSILYERQHHNILAKSVATFKVDVQCTWKSQLPQSTPWLFRRQVHHIVELEFNQVSFFQWLVTCALPSYKYSKTSPAHSA